MEDKSSWEVDEYPEGQWTVSVRQNNENDRVDEGDSPDNNSDLNETEIQNNGTIEEMKQAFSRDTLLFK